MAVPELLRSQDATLLAAQDPGATLQIGAVVLLAGPPLRDGDGVLRLLKIQPPSGRVMGAEAYLAAHSLSGAEFVD